MVNYPYSTDFLAPLPPNPVLQFCERFNGLYNDDKLLDVSAIANKPFHIHQFNHFTYKFTGSRTCNSNLFKLHRTIQMFKNQFGIWSQFGYSWLAFSSEFAQSMFQQKKINLIWKLQTCTELTMPMCSKDVKKYNMFSPSDWDFEAFSDNCYKQFKVRPNTNMWKMNYGMSFE